MNDQRGSGLLVGLIIASLLLVPLLFMLQLGYLDKLTSNFRPAGEEDQSIGASSPADAINQASQVKIQADLKTILVALQAYYANENSVPSSLPDLDTATQIDPNVIYKKCSASSAYFYHNSSGYPGYLLNDGASEATSGQAPTCS